MAFQFFLKEMKAEISPHVDSSAGCEKRPPPSARNNKTTSSDMLKTQPHIWI